MLGGIVLIFLLLFGKIEDGASNSRKHALSMASNMFGDDLYRELARREGNIVVSPFSLHSILTVLTLGAEGSTRKELVTKLYLTNIADFEHVYAIVYKRTYEAIDTSVRIASTIFHDISLSLLKKFKIAAKAFGVTPHAVPFNNKEQTCDIINRWVMRATRDTISSIIEPQQLSPYINLIIVNAIFFQGRWKMAFNRSHTIDNAPFHTPKGVVTCSLMTMKHEKYYYFGHKHYHLLEMPFSRSEIKMLLIVPVYRSTKPSTLRSMLGFVERTFDTKTLHKSLKKMELTLMSIYIPKFRVSSNASLKRSLKLMGLVKMFGDANFTGMLPATEQVTVHEVDQKTTVDVSEEGVTASTVSSAQLGLRFNPAQVLVVDVPFIFLLYDSKSKVILIKGRVENLNVTTDREVYHQEEISTSLM